MSDLYSDPTEPRYDCRLCGVPMTRFETATGVYFCRECDLNEQVEVDEPPC